MSKNIEIKAIQVTFNVLDPEQRRAYEHAYSKTNSSGYIKRLIDRDMTGIAPTVATVQSSIPLEQVGNDFEFDVGGFV
ncbi:hypothetical protein [Paenibacillus pseudetheri]|uniref:Uncharacterized protein n=1 Tax=Paenibacillus pseudetheri TaxID=2897682 RepID=A0ABM9B6B9_9BACL|nr:hypothetical protein [Paenibacillus pseudetheri]CAH1054039.1 hypothetical protein PAECIP111894_00184 [Paenibacillus pseudetheri]